MVFGRAGECCEACHAARDPDRKVWMEAHERWAYDDAQQMQTLRRLICLCTSCHRATHFGLAQVRGQDDEALAHLMQVNRWTQRQAQSHVDDALALWRRRSAIDWRLDFTVLTGAGIRLNPPPAASDRRSVAASIASEVRPVEQPARRGLFRRRRAG